MKFFTVILLILFQMLCIENGAFVKEFDNHYFFYDLQKDNTQSTLDSLFKEAVVIDVYGIENFRHDLHFNDSEFPLDSVLFFKVFQVDSLTKMYNRNYPPSTILGKCNLRNSNAFIVKRNFGEWFLTIDLLLYDNDFKLKSLLILAAFGGDEGYVYEGTGFFDNDSVYVYTGISELKDELEFWKCNGVFQKHLITKEGEVSLLEKKSFEVDCSVE